MKHYLSVLLLTILAIPALAQLSCDNIDEICQKATQLINEGKYETASNGLYSAKSDPGIRNCPDANKMDDLISLIDALQHSSAPEPHIYTINGVSFKMLPVEGGSFDMEYKSFGQGPIVHRVTLSGFAIGETEVTQALWLAVMGNNPSSFKGDDLPVEQVSWEDCQTFIRRLNEMTKDQRPDGREFRLPTEAEWEFAARGGNKSSHTKYAGSSTIGDVAWCKENSNLRTHPVAQKAPNELGLYDMSGNVYEWCHDYYDSGYYSKSPSANPCNDKRSIERVIRGGSYSHFAVWNLVSTRFNSNPRFSYSYIGLRLAL